MRALPDRVLPVLRRLPSANIPLLVVAGSELHGCQSLDGEQDDDIFGVVIESLACQLRPAPFESLVWRTAPDGVRSQAGDIDLVVFSLRKFAHLLLKGNPSVLNMCFAPDALCYRKTTTGRIIQSLAEHLISKRTGRQYLGYLTAQLERMQGKRGGKDVNRPGLVAKYGYDCKYAMHAIRLGMQGIEFLETRTIVLPSPYADLLVNVRHGGYTQAWCEDKILQELAHLESLVHSDELPEDNDIDAVTGEIAALYVEAWDCAETWEIA